MMVLHGTLVCDWKSVHLLNLVCSFQWCFRVWSNFSVLELSAEPLMQYSLHNEDQMWICESDKNSRRLTTPKTQDSFSLIEIFEYIMEKLICNHNTTNLIGFSDLFDLWVIKIKSPRSFAHVVRRDHANRHGTKRRSRRDSMPERFVYSIVKITRIYDFQKWQIHLRQIHEVRKGFWAFFLGCAFRMLIGWVSNTSITWTKARKLYISYDKKLVERPVPNREALVAFKGAVSATPLFLFTSGNNELNCLK